MGTDRKDLFVRPVSLTIANSGETLDAYVGITTDAFRAARQVVEQLLDVEGIDVLVIDEPDMTIPQWGVGGYTYGPHTILVALDPAANIDGRNIERTLVHEFNHAMRWRGPGCDGNLGQMLVSEGMAVLFEEEVFGDIPMFGSVSITTDEIAEALTALYETQFNQEKWFFGADGITLWFGYTYGYQLCRNYATSIGKRASQLIDVASREVLKLLPQ